MKVYIASPLGFSAPGRYWSSEVLHPALVQADFEILDPWDDDAGLVAAFALQPDAARDKAMKAASRDLAAKNFALLREADALLAVLDGTDVDSGTSAEMGYACALGIPVVGLRTDVRSSGDHEAVTVNLQVEECVHSTGGIITEDVERAVMHLRHLGPRTS